MTDVQKKDLYTTKVNSMFYEGSIKLSVQDLMCLSQAIYSARMADPDSFEYYSEVFLKIHAMEAEMNQEVLGWHLKQRMAEVKLELVKLELAEARLAAATAEHQKKLEAQEQAA